MLGKLPKEAASVMDEENWADLGALTAAEDPTLEFGQIARIREKARKAFVRADIFFKSPKGYTEEECTNHERIWCWRSCLLPDGSIGMVPRFLGSLALMDQKLFGYRAREHQLV